MQATPAASHHHTSDDATQAVRQDGYGTPEQATQPVRSWGTPEQENPRTAYTEPSPTRRPDPSKSAAEPAASLGGQFDDNDGRANSFRDMPEYRESEFGRDADDRDGLGDGAANYGEPQPQYYDSKRSDESATAMDGPAAKKKSAAPKAAAAVLLLALLGGGGYAYTQLNKSDDKTSASAPSASDDGSAAPGSANPSASSNGSSESTESATTKPAKMPDLKGKTLDEAKALLSDQVKVQITQQLKEDMDGAEQISKQEPAAGQATPDTVKLTVDQPANVQNVSASTDSNLLVSNAFSDSGQIDVYGKPFDRPMAHSFDKYSSTDPATIELNVNRSYSRFVSQVGVSSASEDTNRQYTVKVLADNKQVYAQTVKFNEAPQTINLDVSNVLRLKIEVTTSGNSDNDGSSTLAFGDMRLLYLPGQGPRPTDSPTN